MRHRKHIFKIGRRSDHVRSLLANQVCSLIHEGRIKTTVVKAKETRRLAERLVTLGKKGQLQHRRRAISLLRPSTNLRAAGRVGIPHEDGKGFEKSAKQEAVRKLFSQIAPKYIDRPGGYTRIIRVGTRRGDGADMCYLEFVEEELNQKQRKAPAKKKAQVESMAKAPVAELVVEEAVIEEPGAEAAVNEVPVVAFAAEVPGEEEQKKSGREDQQPE